MDLFREYVFAWWQIGLLKVSLIALGIIIGCRWNEFFRRKVITVALWIVFAIPAIYLVLVTLKQL